MLGTVHIDDKQQICVVGIVDMGSVKQVCAEGNLLLRNLNKVTVDLSGIVDADSSCLAMLIEWIRSAREQGKPVEFKNAPRAVLDLGRVCGLDEILPLDKVLTW